MNKFLFTAAAALSLAACSAVSTRPASQWTYSTQALAAMQQTFGTTGLKPGGYRWVSNVPDSGAASIVVDLSAQRAYVYRAGEMVGVTSVSTGRQGKQTPTGIF